MNFSHLLMDIDKIAHYIILLHAGLGGIALLAGGFALSVKKGSQVHKKSGKVFYFSMLSSVLLSLVISNLPKHESPFLFSIGVLSIYLLISGLRSLRYKRNTNDLSLDKVLSYLMCLTGLAMLISSVLFHKNLHIVLFVFGIVGMIFGITDLKRFKNVEELHKIWLQMHLGKMIGGYIAAVTAFFVVNQILPGVWNWFTPGIIGSGYIIFWNRKLAKKKST